MYNRDDRSCRLPPPVLRGILAFAFDRAAETALDGAVLHVGERAFALGAASRRSGGSLFVWEESGLAWSHGARIDVRLSAPDESAVALSGLRVAYMGAQMMVASFRHHTLHNLKPFFARPTLNAGVSNECLLLALFLSSINDHR